MNASRISLIVIRSKDIDRAKRFYEILGVEFERHKHGKGLEHLAASWGDLVFEIYPLRDSDLPTISLRLGFSVTSCDDLTRELMNAGCIVRSQPGDSPWGRVSVVEDFDGHKVELVEKL
jgi:lactoylglutathione lyase